MVEGLLGSRVRALRKQRGLTQQELAEATDLSVAMISMLERHQRTPHLTTLDALAKALKVEVGDLFEPNEVAHQPHEKHLEAKVREGRLSLPAACRRLNRHRHQDHHTARH